MKCITLAKDLKPNNNDHNGLSSGTAKYYFEKFAKNSEARYNRSSNIRGMEKRYVVRNNGSDRKAALGSEDFIHTNEADIGLFASVFTAYNNHWKLRISPEDWWYVVIRRVAIAIDKNSKKEKVRHMFVDHEGKKTLTVKVVGNNIHDINYTSFFNQMSEEISKNVKVPDYIDLISADFSLTTPVQKIVSQITLTSSLQEFFEYRVRFRCGIPSVEMLGTEDDWQKLLTKLDALQSLLEPIKNELGLGAEWWLVAKDVFQKLLDTYCGHPDCDWWSKIVTFKEFGSGLSGFTGWMTHFLEGSEEHIEFPDFTSGLVTVPLTISHPSGTQDQATLVAGCLGFTLHQNDDNVPSIQPFQGWSLLLPKNSPFCVTKSC